MSDTNGQPDPDIRTEPLEGTPLPDDDLGVGAQDPGGDSDTAGDPRETKDDTASSDTRATTSTEEENRAADEVDDDERPRPSTDAETQEDTVSGGPAD